jgi:GT2 family glycosyltransferase
MPTFSLLLPTRDRIELVNRFFQSLVDTTTNIEDIEIILAIDEDDVSSQNINHSLLNLKKVILPKGSTMGDLNRSCFEASSGRYIMLVNDDIIVRTKNWDKAILEVLHNYEDEVVLIHVNDLLFRETLPTFPLLSRKTCLEIGLCPSEYQRYRIDDHIYEIYNLLAYLGHKRIVYLPDIIFEHDNYSLRQNLEPHQQLQGQTFQSADDKVYLPNPEIIEKDEGFFKGSLEQRKLDALRLASLIDQHKYQQQQFNYEGLLENIRDSFSYRKTQFIGKVSTSGIDNLKVSNRVTIAVVTSSIYKPHARKCLAVLKKYTTNFDLIILDNNEGKDFNHPREMNKVLKMVKTDFLVLMDDDVFVSKGWLEGLFASLDDKTGVLAPLHRDKRGRLSFSGVYLKGDGLGSHAHLLDIPDKPRECQCLCSALLLIDMRKCGEILFNENYQKYFLDLDYSLKIWEAGYKVICTPYTTITHIGGGTLAHRTEKADMLFSSDSQTFIINWVVSGKLGEIENKVWFNFPYLKLTTDIPNRISSAFHSKKASDDSLDIDEKSIIKLINDCKSFYLFQEILAKQLVKSILTCEVIGNNEKASSYQKLLGLLPENLQVELKMQRLEVYKQEKIKTSYINRLLFYYLPRAYCVYRMYGKKALLNHVSGFLRFGHSANH